MLIMGFVYLELVLILPCRRYGQLVIQLSNKSPSALFDLYSHIGSITHQTRSVACVSVYDIYMYTNVDR